MRTTGDWLRFCATAGASALGVRRSLNCVWELTYRCNARCGMCDYWRRPTLAAEELQTSDVIAGLDKIADHGCRLVNFSGGEPLLRDDLEAIVAHASGLGIWTSTVTNGSLLTHERLRSLRDAGLDSLLVSLDSMEPAVHDRGRGVPGLHEKVLECMDMLARDFISGHRIGGFMTVITPANLASVPRLIELAEKLGVYALLQPLHGRKTGNTEILRLPPSLAQSLIQMKRSSASMLNSRAYLTTMSDSGDPSSGSCSAGRKYLSVDPFGGLHPCVDLPAVGHILEDDIAAVSSTDSSSLVDGCSGCRYCFRGEADATLSPGGCLEKFGLGLRVIRRNFEAGRARKVAGELQET